MNSKLSSARHPPVTKNQIVHDLRKIGITKGNIVAVSLSLKSVGFVEGGPDAFIDALLEVVGLEGTIMMNTFTQFFPIREMPYDYIFDALTTIPYTGIVPTTLMKRQSSVRSRHPTCSVVSTGKMADYLTHGHDEKSKAFLPYEKLAQIGGKYLSVGIGNNLVAIRHEAQRKAGISTTLPVGVRYKDAKGETKLFIFESPPCAANLTELIPKLDMQGIVKRGQLGMVSTIIANANEVISSMSSMLSENPQLNLCNNIYCLRCRELERKMNLYDRIANPALHQRSRLARKIVSFRNRLILKKYSHVAFCELKRNGNSNIFSTLCWRIIDAPLALFQKIQNYLVRSFEKNSK